MTTRLSALRQSMLQFFASLMNNIIVTILVGTFGVSALIAWVTGTLDFLIQYMNTPIPLWATILLVVLCCRYTYLKVPKSNPSSSPQPIKYCECCPINERHPLIRTGGTSKRSFYICPNTKQSYSVPHVLE